MFFPAFAYLGYVYIHVRVDRPTYKLSNSSQTFVWIMCVIEPKMIWTNSRCRSQLSSTCCLPTQAVICLSYLVKYSDLNFRIAFNYVQDWEVV